MKLILELEIDVAVGFQLDSDTEQQVDFMQRKFIEKINDLIVDAQVDRKLSHDIGNLTLVKIVL